MHVEKGPTLSLARLLEIRKDFLEKFPPVDNARNTAIFANWFHEQYGMKIVVANVLDDCIGVSPRVLMALMGKEVPK